jgi:pantoate--beta-alanine ligase
MSSRNTYLDNEERKAALVLNRSLKNAVERVKSGENNPSRIKEYLVTEISSEKMAKIDYVEIVDVNTLQEAHALDGEILIALAVFFGKTRLIDNVYFSNY